MAADDYGVMRCSAVTLQAANDALAEKSARSVLSALQRLIDVALLVVFEHQGSKYVCQLDWQDFQKIRYPRESHEPTPTAEILHRCSGATAALFAQRSRKISETQREDSENDSEVIQSLPRAPAREEANGLRLEANGKRLTAKGGGGALAGSLPRDHMRHVHCGRKCVPDFLHAEFKQGLGGDEADAALRLLGSRGTVGWYRMIEEGLPPGPIGEEPIKFWRAQFSAAFQSAATKAVSNALPSADELTKHVAAKMGIAVTKS